MPNYFSGTNCRASGVVIPPNGWSIAYMELDVGGETTDSLVDLSGEPTPPMGRNLKVMFDSTHFTPLDDITVSIYAIIYDPNSSAWDEYFVESDGVMVQNRSTSFGRFDMEDPYVTWEFEKAIYLVGYPSWQTIPFVPWVHEQMNYYQYVAEHSQNWSMNSIEAFLPHGNSTFFHTHGNASEFWTDHNDYYSQWLANPNGPPSIAPEWVTPQVVLPIRGSANGTGVPPFNTGEPPINVAFMMACETGLSNDFEYPFLFPEYNAYISASQGPEDQAQLGYSINILLARSAEQALTFYSYLDAGWDVDAAAAACQAVYRDAEGNELDFPQGSSLILCHGDPTTKLHGVYTGSHSLNSGPTLAWWRTL